MKENQSAHAAAIRLRRAKVLRGLALAASYPLTHSGDAAQAKSVENAFPPEAAPPLRRQPPPGCGPEERPATPWKKSVDK
jgi:hypothetical protein